MKTSHPKISKTQIVGVAIVIIGIIIGLYLVQRQQILRGQATQELYDAFTITSNQPGKTVDKTGPNSFETDTLNIQIMLTNPDAITGN